MIRDCLFNVLQFSDIQTTAKCLKTTKEINSYINKQYFWKQFCVRDFINDYNNIKLDGYYEKYKQCYIFKLLKNEFKYGRMYQLVIDKSKSIPQSQNRKYEIIKYIESKTKYEIIDEANQIINKHNNKKSNKQKLYNEFANMELNEYDEYIDNFYLGRCVQFILDSDNTIFWKDIFNQEYINDKQIIEKAHEMKSKILYPTIEIGKKFYIKSCENCCIWYYGDTRCSCGNRKYVLNHIIINSLDETDVLIYAEPYCYFY